MAQYLNPIFDNMNEDELAAYNSTVATQEQVKCVTAQIDYDRGIQKVCGTLLEIQELTKPQTLVRETTMTIPGS